jgi:formylglycine-generating enzyme required for sulfatase activity
VIKGGDSQIMVLVNKGKNKMGTNEADMEKIAASLKSEGLKVDPSFTFDEIPSMTIDLDAYYIGKYETTNDSYIKCVDAKICKSGLSQDGFRDQSKRNHPVVNITFEQANEYCKWAGGRLPTEKEWEKAARGNDGRLFPWGNHWNPKALNWDDGGDEDGYSGTAPVGSFELGKSPYGAYDLSGNVWEWTSDWYKGYSQASKQYPEYGEKYKVIRGGGWFNERRADYRTSLRFGCVPLKAAEYLGFRCMIELPIQFSNEVKIK